MKHFLLLACPIILISMVIVSCNKKNDNEIPVISIQSTPPTSVSNRIPAGEPLLLHVSASDPDNDQLYYLWKADGGHFSGDIDKASVEWISPLSAEDENYKITAFVSDGIAIPQRDLIIYVGGITLYSVSGHIYHEGTLNSISGVHVMIDSLIGMTAGDGYYEIENIPEGDHILTASAEGYNDFSVNLELNPGSNTFDIEMISSQAYKLHGNITSKSNGTGMEGCKIAILNPDGTESEFVTFSSSDGYYELLNVPAGGYEVRISENCYLETYLEIENSDLQYDAQFETEFTDPRDSRTYKVTEIGGQTWMAENLNHGIMIFGGLDQEDNQVIEKYCYDNNESYCETYGGLYLWNEMMQYDNSPGIQGICPHGWHLPAFDEWNSMIEYLGGEDIAGGKLKQVGTEHWLSPNNEATNESGFAGLGSGRHYRTGSFDFIHEDTYFFSSTETDPDYVRSFGLFYGSGKVFVPLIAIKVDARSVRCVKD